MKRRSFWLIAGFSVTFVAAILFRGMVASHEIARQKEAAQCNFAPFTVESAIMYKLARDYADGRAIGGRDERFIGPTQTLSEQMSLGLEYYLGTMLKIRRCFYAGNPAGGEYEDHPGEAAFVRHAMLLPIGLLCALMFLLLWTLTRSIFFTAAGTLFYLIAPAAVARYTGQDLLKGEFALPWVLGAITFMEMALRSRRKWPWIGCTASAFLAAANWDASQIILGSVGLWEIVRCFFAARGSRNRAQVLTGLYLGLALAGALVAYPRVHGALLSPVLLWIFPAAIAGNLLKRRRFRRWKFAGIAAGLGALFFAVTYGSVFAANYSHFGTLVEAKLRFWNTKPENPLLLNFDQRFLWTPSLDSATAKLVLIYFPGAIFAGFAIWIWGFFVSDFRRQARKYMMYLFLSVGYLVAHIYFLRYHVFAALFAAPMLTAGAALLYRSLRRRRRAAAIAVVSVFLGAVAWEGISTVRRQRFYEPALPYKADLIRLLRASNWNDKVVLGDLDISSLAFGYAGQRIVVQPKFELKEVRTQVRQYIEKLFDDEDAFRRYCAEYGVDFVIFTRGTALADMHIYNLRYMAAAKELRRDMTAYKMDVEPHKLRHFYELEIPGKYHRAAELFRIFYFVSPERRALSGRLYRQALAARRNGEMVLFKKLLGSAYLLDPVSEDIYGCYFAAFKTEPPVLKPGDFGLQKQR